MHKHLATGLDSHFCRFSSTGRAIFLPGLLFVCFLFAPAPGAFAQGSKPWADDDPVLEKHKDKDANKERNREHPDQRDHWMMRGRAAPRGKSAAAMRLKAYRRKLAMRGTTRRRSPELGALPAG